MKKILSLALALVMMMAICVPAFAGTLDASTPSSDVPIKTDISSITTDGTYSVTIPATMDIKWNATKTDFNYSVTSHLKAGKAVNVTVAQKNAAMVAADANNTSTIEYSLTGTLNATTNNPVVTNAGFDFSVIIDQSEFDEAAIAVYSDAVTFTAAVVNA